MSATSFPDTQLTIPSADHEVWYTRCPVPTAFELALANGTFDEEFRDSGLEWLQIAESTDPAVNESHFTHRKARSFRHGGNIPAIYARSRGADTVVIGTSWPRTTYPVLALPESGITRAADLAGKRLLVPRRRGDSLDFWAASTFGVWESALASAGLGFDDVELVEIWHDEQRLPGPDEADLQGRLRWSARDRRSFTRAILLPLARGEVDAVTAQTTLGEELQALTGSLVVYEQADQHDLFARVNNGSPDTLTVSTDLVRERPDVVARVLARLIEAAEWARLNETRALETFAHRLQSPTSLLETTYGDQLVGHLDVGLPPETTEILQLQQDRLLRHGFIDQPFDTANWIDPRPLEWARELLADRSISAG